MTSQCSHFKEQWISQKIMAETQKSSTESCQWAGECCNRKAYYIPFEINEVKHSTGKKLIELNPNWTE